MFKKNKKLSSEEINEMNKFYLMLQKIKMKRPNFDVKRIMKVLYGEKFENQKNCD